MSNIQKIGDQILYGLLIARELNVPYFVKENFDDILCSEDDLFISDDDIIKHVQKMLADNYELEIIPVQREFMAENPEDNFFYGDIELKLNKINETI